MMIFMRKFLDVLATPFGIMQHRSLRKYQTICKYGVQALENFSVGIFDYKTESFKHWLKTNPVFCHKLIKYPVKGFAVWYFDLSYGTGYYGIYSYKFEARRVARHLKRLMPVVQVREFEVKNLREIEGDIVTFRLLEDNLFDEVEKIISDESKI